MTLVKNVKTSCDLLEKVKRIEEEKSESRKGLRQKDWKRKEYEKRNEFVSRKNVSKKDWKQKIRGDRKYMTKEDQYFKTIIGDMILAKKNFASKLNIAIIAEIDHDDYSMLKVYFIDRPELLDKVLTLSWHEVGNNTWNNLSTDLRKLIIQMQSYRN